MDIGAVRACLGDSLQRTLALMTSKLESSTSLLVDVNASLLERQGKLLRPMLCLLVASACGGIGEDSIRYAAASELMHTASLLHDDVIDNSATRRGRPTVYSRLGATGSVLVGDFWLVRCIDCILDGEKESGKVIRLFAKTISDLTEGELLQMDKASRGDTTEDDYYRIVYAKTASLFEVAARSGAISAGASSRVQEAAATFAREMGIAFQIEDDIFDYQEDGSRLGKPVGVDLMERKITLPLLCAFRTDPVQEARIRPLIARIPGEPALAEDIRAFVRESGGLSLAAKLRDARIETAVLALSALPDSKEKSYLADLARYVGERTC